MKGFLTIENYGNAVYEIERSKFICQMFYVENETDAKSRIDSVKKEHSIARHNVYAYTLNSGEEKFSDDGEPKGTGGYALLQLLRLENLKNVVVVVTRYFGGIKLGVGGLKRAYEKSLSMAISNTKPIFKELSQEYKFSVSYEEYSKLNNYLSRSKNKVVNLEYLNEVNLSVLVPIDNVNEFIIGLNNEFSGSIEYKEGEKRYINY